MEKRREQGKERLAVAAVLAAGAAGCVLAALAAPWSGQIVTEGELFRRASELLVTCALTAVVEEVVFRGILLDVLLYAGNAARALRGRRSSPSAALHAKHAERRRVADASCGAGEPCDGAARSSYEGAPGPAVLVAAVVGSAAVFAVAHIVPAPGQPWPADAAEMAAAALKIAQALLFGIAMAGLRLAALLRASPAGCSPTARGTLAVSPPRRVSASPASAGVPPSPPCSAPSPSAGIPAASSSAALLLAPTPAPPADAAPSSPSRASRPASPGGGGNRRFAGLAVPIATHLCFDVLYFAPAVMVEGTFPLTYLSTAPAEWAVVAVSSVILLWPAAWALGLARRGVLPYDDDQDRRPA